MIPHNRPLITDEDRSAVQAVLCSPWIAGGQEVEALEHDFDRLFGGGGSCAVSSGTAALYVALTALGIGSGDAVGVPTYSCSALLDAVFAVGGRPFVVDVSPRDFTMDPEWLERRAPARLAATIAVHTHGARAPVEALAEAGAGVVVQDCCHSLGGRAGAELIGADGSASVFSFYATKIVTCGHGGLLHDPDGSLAATARAFRDTETRPEYRPRFNVHLTDFQSAMARSQLRRLATIAEARRSIARCYLAALPAGVDCVPATVEEGRLVHRFILRTSDASERGRFRRHFTQHGVTTVEPVDRDDLLHRYLGLDPSDFPASERLAQTTLSLPLYPALTETEVESVCESLRTLPV